MTEWNLRSRSHICHKCTRSFTDGERCCSSVAAFNTPIVQELLAEKIAIQATDPKAVKPPDFIRLDFCEGCWSTVADQDWISGWRGVYTAPEPPTPEPLPRETAESLLTRLLEGEDSGEQMAVIFILAVMLERKKILLERQVRRQPDGKLLRVYEHRKTGEVMLIADPDLQVDELPGVQKQVQLLLEPPPPPEPEAAVVPRSDSPADVLSGDGG